MSAPNITLLSGENALVYANIHWDTWGRLDLFLRRNAWKNRALLAIPNFLDFGNFLKNSGL